MNKQLILTAMLLVGIVFTSQAQFKIGETKVPAKETKEVVVGNDTSRINWTSQYVEATGWSIMDTKRFTIQGQARAMARRGAIVDAQRNLLERIEGVRIYGETIVKDYVTVNDQVITRLEGVLKGAVLISEKVVGNTVEVVMRIPIYEGTNGKNSVADVIHSVIETEEVEETTEEVTEEITEEAEEENIVFNFTGDDVDPALFPRIVDEEGRTQLDFAELYEPGSGKFPKYLNMTKTFFEVAGFQKGVQVIDIIRGENGNYEFDTEKYEGKKINWGRVGNFIMKTGSIILTLI